MSDIFVSYAREDLEYAKLLAEALEARGWSTWWDRSIPAGKSYRRMIAEELAAARCVVVIWSGHSLESDWVHDEAEEGFRRRILVPVLIEDISLPLGFRGVQAANVVQWARSRNPGDLGALLADIALMLDSSSPAAAADGPRDGAIPTQALDDRQGPSLRGQNGREPRGSPAAWEDRRRTQPAAFWATTRGRTVGLIGVGIVAIAGLGGAIVPLASVTQDDVLEYYGWIDGSRVDHPMPGQIYAIAEQGVVPTRVCELTQGDVSMQSREVPGSRFINVLGRALPVPSAVLPYTFTMPGFVVDSASLSDLSSGMQRILRTPDIEDLRASDQKALDEVLRLETCARAIVSSLDKGLAVCQLTAVAGREGSPPFGVGFADHCLTKAGAPPQPLPDIADRPLSTRLKASLGLIDRRPQ